MCKRLLLAILTLALFSGNAAAEGGDFGLGIIVGEPTGFIGKLFVSEKNAFDVALAWSLESPNYMHIHGDYLYHHYFVADFGESQGEFGAYLGFGGRIALVDDHDDHVGIRFPLGIAYFFSDDRFDTFLEIVPIMDVAPKTDFDVEGAIGLRFFF